MERGGPILSLDLSVSGGYTRLLLTSFSPDFLVALGLWSSSVTGSQRLWWVYDLGLKRGSPILSLDLSFSGGYTRLPLYTFSYCPHVYILRHLEQLLLGWGLVMEKSQEGRELSGFRTVDVKHFCRTFVSFDYPFL